MVERQANLRPASIVGTYIRIPRLQRREDERVVSAGAGQRGRRSIICHFGKMRAYTTCMPCCEHVGFGPDGQRGTERERGEREMMTALLAAGGPPLQVFVLSRSRCSPPRRSSCAKTRRTSWSPPAAMRKKKGRTVSPTPANVNVVQPPAAPPDTDASVVAPEPGDDLSCQSPGDAGSQRLSCHDTRGPMPMLMPMSMSMPPC